MPGVFPAPTAMSRFTAPWVAELLEERPESARYPRWMTDVHPEAVGSYGGSMTRWAAEEMGIRLRWFQRLGNARQLEHRADGSLCWRYVVESTPRRVGKSVRLKALAGWRLDHAELLGETQTVLFTGKDLPICKEIHSSAWAWAMSRGWTVSRGMGNEAITASDGSRWLVRSQNGVYGYPAGLALCDESWKVPPHVIGEGLQPALMDRANPQLLLTSTAHTQATQLMRRRIRDALAELVAPGATLLLLWGADPLTAAEDPLAAAGEASPHTDPMRNVLVADAWRDALSGVVDPEFGEADPVAGFLAQYANVWPALDAKPDVGTALVSQADWGLLEVPGLVVWSTAGVESAFGESPVVVLAGRLPDGRAAVSAVQCRDSAEAARVCRTEGVAQVLVGKSLLRDEVPWQGLPVEGRTATSAQAVAELGRLLRDGVLAHDGGEVLSGQVLGVRTESTAAGVRLVSEGRVDAVKAAVWAAHAARSAVDWLAL